MLGNVQDAFFAVAPVADHGSLTFCWGMPQLVCLFAGASPSGPVSKTRFLQLHLLSTRFVDFLLGHAPACLLVCWGMPQLVCLFACLLINKRFLPKRNRETSGPLVRL